MALPCVNIGRRQQGRLRAINVIDVPAKATEITAAIQRARSVEFLDSLAGMRNPYGDGHASEQIASVLADVAIDERLLIKKAPAVQSLAPAQG